MTLSLREKLEILLIRRDMTITALAKQMGYSRQALAQRMNRENMGVQDLAALADALNCELDIKFIMRDTGKEI